MLQTFDVTGAPEQGPPRLSVLRDVMAQEGIKGFLVPRADVHQGEYVAPADERLAWLTGFTGSAGFAAILSARAGVFVDGRYRLQARNQVDDTAFAIVPWPDTKLADWLKAELPEGGTVGFDPWLHTVGEIETLRKALTGTPIDLADCPNLIDRVWPDRPAPPAGDVTPYPEALAGRSSAEKRALVAEALRQTGDESAVLTLPDSIAWLLNIRGSDIARIPVPHAFAIIHADGSVDLFVAPEKTAGLGDGLGPDVRLHEPGAFPAALGALTGQVRLDKQSMPYAVPMLIEAGNVRYDRDPCLLPKACKTAAELDGTREAHLRDGAAMVEFLHWLNGQADALGHTDHALSEIDVVTALEGFRRSTNQLRDISFETICGAGPNGAIVHYRVTRETNRILRAGELLLVDSGGQYLDGTTDITRTIALGPPESEACACYTRVLQGMIAISRARWPVGLAGRDLDALARYELWQAGLDYDHGTGHGVGTYLSVHEGPQRLSRQSGEKLRPGMILSNEPGYYREGAFGIRIENLIAVEEAPAVPGGDAQRRMLCFETLTYVPLDRRLIAVDMLTQAQRTWIDAYHAETRRRLGDRVSANARIWLETATAPL
ncbi:MAG: aminopeptidase P family protein [Rhodobacteraceae bacterium]|nr:aminopeptidase P family protein [Paracoccaceae bacterium]